MDEEYEMKEKGREAQRKKKREGGGEKDEVRKVIILNCPRH